MNKIIFKVAGVKDATSIGGLLKNSYQSLEKSLSKGKQAYVSEVRRGYHYVVAKKGQKVVGLAAWFYHGLPKHGLIEIDRFAVKKELRRTGIGTELFKFLVTDANNFFKKSGGLRKIYLFTRKSNLTAHKFYKSLGFKKEAEVKNQFYKGKNDLIFSKFI